MRFLFYNRQVKYIVGIDEAGRGPLAGPVAVGVFVIAENKLKKLDLSGLRDSKKLSKKKREEWRERICKMKKEGIADFAVVLVSEKHIDKNRIHNSIKSGIEKGIKKLKVGKKDKIFLDGGLRLDKTFIFQETIIKGDEKIPVIALASIMAKTERDRKMISLSKKYPEYGFEDHMGYGTRKHADKIRFFGPSPMHRKSFLKSFDL